MKKNAVTVAITTYSEHMLAGRLLGALLHGDHLPDFILTANGRAEASNMFDEFKRDVTEANVQVVHNDTNLGFWRPANHALELCDTEFLCLINDDVFPPKDWFGRLVEPFRKDPKLVFACPENTCSQIRQDFEGQRGLLREYCEGSFLMMRTAIVKRHGLFDPNLPGMAYGEDLDASLTYRRLGYNLAWVPMAFMHVRGATSSKLHPAKLWLQMNKAYLRRKWDGYFPDRVLTPLQPADSTA